MKYVIVIPAKNEAEGISVTIDSILSQTLLPESVLVLDDGSTDQMRSVIEHYMAKSSLIQYYFNEQSETTYVLGGKIVKLFLKGKSLIDSQNIEYDFIVKMDADIRFGPQFMEAIALKVKSDNFGIVSGTPFAIENDRKVFIISPEWHTNGDFKIYNRKFLESSENFPKDLGWDCADNLLAIEKGFSTAAFRDINYEQNRPIGRFSSKKGRKRQGLGAYKLGYSWSYLTLKVLHDLVKPPFITGSWFYLSGYFEGKLKKLPKTVNHNQQKLLRKLMWQSFSQRLKNRNFFIFQLFSNTSQSGKA